MNQNGPLEREIPWSLGLLAFIALLILMLALSTLLSMIAVLTGDPLEMQSGIATPLGLAIQVALVSALFTATALGVPRIARIPVKRRTAPLPQANPSTAQLRAAWHAHNLACAWQRKLAGEYVAYDLIRPAPKISGANSHGDADEHTDSSSAITYHH